jgi:hypothetical protein
MDEIIPATDGMPAASQVGSLDYLERVVPSLEISSAAAWLGWTRKAANRQASPLRNCRTQVAWKF